MIIEASTVEDLPKILELYDLARQYQTQHFPGNIWPHFQPDFIAQEIKENLQFNLKIQGEISCVWAIAFSDSAIWEEKEKNDAIYLHRIATNPDFRGQNFVKTIAEWAQKFARKQHKNFLRMDTCGENLALINHYQKCGFTFLGMHPLKDSSTLPPHYHNAEVCFFEIKL